MSELDLEALLDRVLDAARELTGARYAALGVLDEEKRELERFLFVGVDRETQDLIGDLPRGRGVLGELIRNPKPLRLRNVSEHPRSYGFPKGHPPMGSFLGTPVVLRDEVYGNLYLTDKQGADEFTEADEQLVTALAGWAAVAIENARLYTRAEQRREELERAVRGLQTTAALSREIGGETELERVLELVTKRGRALIDARSLLVLLPDGERLRVAAAAGELPGELVGRAITLPGAPLEGSQGYAVELNEQDLRSALAHLGIEAKALLPAVLTHRGFAAGLLVAIDRTDDSETFRRDEELLLSSFAASAGTAVATAQAIESERRVLAVDVSERERRRWARELHDETLQDLGALKLLQETALERRDPEVMAKALQRAGEQLEQTIGGLHSLISDLRPAALDDIGVHAAIEALIERVAARTDIEFDVRLDLAFEGGRAETRHQPELESTIYRLVQEAVNNVIKHADAQHVWVEVDEGDNAVSITVRDDGRGFDPGSTRDGAFGVMGMRERAALIGGTLTIETEEGEGTTVRATLPILRRSLDGAGPG